MGKIIDEMKSSLEIAGGSIQEVSQKGCSVGFGEPDSLPMPFSSDNFHEISPVSVSSLRTSSKMTFIDGGNAEILSSPGASLHFLRVFHTVYKDGSRVSCGSDEFYALAAARAGDGGIFYDAKLFRSRAGTLTDTFFSTGITFDSLDSALRDGNRRFSISLVPSYVRRLAELSTALLLAGNAERGDVIVLDGDLGARLPEERKLLSALSRVASENGVFICALSKTCRLLTSAGLPVSVMLDRNSPRGMWFYHPVMDTSGSGVAREVCFAKLHPGSDRVFRFETFDPLPEAGVIFSMLAHNSRDPVFLGYPYGLVEADRFARVSNRECECLRTMFMAKAGRDWKHLDSASRAIDAHSVLDNV